MIALNIPTFFVFPSPTPFMGQSRKSLIPSSMKLTLVSLEDMKLPSTSLLEYKTGIYLTPT